jgi:hypothetical protein
MGQLIIKSVSTTNSGDSGLQQPSKKAGRNDALQANMWNYDQICENLAAKVCGFRAAKH